jgi:hypothetical protein
MAVQLAQVNVALPRAPLDSPVMAGFLRVLDDVNWRPTRAQGSSGVAGPSRGR